MNICFVEMGYPAKNYRGGAGTYVRLIAKELLKQGNRVFIVSQHIAGEPSDCEDNGIIIRRIKIKGWSWYFKKIPIIGGVVSRFLQIIELSLSINAVIKEFHKRYNLDFIESCEIPDFLFKIQTCLPYVIHLHGSEHTCKKYCGERIGLEDKLQRRLEGFVIKKADLITTPSQFLKDDIIREFGINDSKIHVIPYPINEQLTLIKEDLSKDIKIVFYAGRLEKRKGVHTLKEAIPLIVSEYPKVKFLFFGADTKSITRNDLISYFERCGVSDKVEIHSFVPQERLFEYLSRADICVVPSIWVNSPNTVYEAMAARRAVVATNVGGIPELVKNGVTGILVEANNTSHLAKSIISLLKDDAKTEEMGKKAREGAIERFGTERIVKKRLAIYKTL